jgi:hypothetical protein
VYRDAGKPEKEGGINRRKMKAEIQNLHPGATDLERMPASNGGYGILFILRCPHYLLTISRRSSG